MANTSSSAWESVLMCAKLLRKLSSPQVARLTVVDRAQPPAPRDQIRDLAHQLLADGVIDARAFATIARFPAAEAEMLPQTLLSLGLARNPALVRSMAVHAGLEVIDPLDVPPDPALIDRLGAGACLRLGILPWGKRHGMTCVLVASPGQIERRSDLLLAGVRVQLVLKCRVRRAVERSPPRSRMARVTISGSWW
jgi:hypothetical protein